MAEAQTHVFNVHEQLDHFFVPRCFENKIYVKKFFITCYNTYTVYNTKIHAQHFNLYIGLLQALIIIVGYTMILTDLKYSFLEILINLLGMAML